MLFATNSSATAIQQINFLFTPLELLIAEFPHLEKQDFAALSLWLDKIPMFSGSCASVNINKRTSSTHPAKEGLLMYSFQLKKQLPLA